MQPIKYHDNENQLDLNLRSTGAEMTPHCHLLLFWSRNCTELLHQGVSTYHTCRQKSGYWHQGQQGHCSFQGEQRTQLDSLDVGSSAGRYTWEVGSQSAGRLLPAPSLHNERED